MITFYLSPSNYCYMEYVEAISSIIALGWKPSMVWPADAFRINSYLKSTALTKAVKAIARSDIFIAYFPGTINTTFEIGLAYSMCEEVFVAAKDPVYFTQTGLADAYLTSLEGIKRACCDKASVPTLLRKEYLYLVNKDATG